MNLKDFAEKGMSYPAFRDMHAQLVAANKTTGENQSEVYLNYAKLNQHRMERIEKTLKLEENLAALVKDLEKPVTALVITEGWCGDSAQNIPVFDALEKLGKNFRTRIVLRDENPELMDQYLTNGSKSIPKVVFIDDNTGKALGTWGPRPMQAQMLMEEGKAKNMEKADLASALHLWYSKDKTMHTQAELLDLFDTF